MILAGDIGGTSSRFGFFQYDGKRVTSLLELQYPTQNAQSFDALVSDFRDKIQASNIDNQKKDIKAVCFGLAGTVRKHIDGHSYVEMTNVPHWPNVESHGLSRLLNGVSVTLINDMSAICYGIEVLDQNDFLVLNPGRPQPGNKALIAAGTGLGEAMLYWNGHMYCPSPSEGGHADFAPRNKDEIELLRYLLKKKPHVSYEQVVSGPGLVSIYEFLLASGKYNQEQQNFSDNLLEIVPDSGEDMRSAFISETGLANKNSLSAKALDMFVSIYAAEAGNVALRYLALNGVYIGGGIAPKIKEKLYDGSFMKNFTAKSGVFSELISNIPVKIILNPGVGLLGAAWYAALMTTYPTPAIPMTGEGVRKS